MKKNVCFIMLFIALSTVAFSQQGFVINHNCTDASVIPQSYLDQSRSLDVFFQHASVGGNIVSGLSDLRASNPGRYSYITGSASSSSSISPSWFQANDGFFDFWLGNPSTEEKYQSFYNVVTNNNLGNYLDVAFMKLCYIDLHHWSGDIVQNANDYFILYRDMMLSLETLYPNTKFVWFTEPLQVSTSDGAFLYYQSYNDFIRNYCTINNKVLFDIADIECYNLSVEKVTTNGYESLFSGYSSDGGHLNALGEQRMAEAWWYMLAKLCGWNVTTIPVTGVSVSPSSVTLNIGGTQQLTATVLPANATNKNVIWSTSNAEVATVSSSGLVTIVGPGTATITATTVDGNKTASSSITVNSGNVAVTGVSVSPTSATLTVGSTQQLQEEVLPANATNKNVTWSTSNAGVATVSTSGLVTAVAPGTATITVTTVDGSKTATSTIIVTSGGGGTNLLLNPGFESGPTGWDLGSVFSVSTVDKYNGDQSLLLTGTGSNTTTAQQITVTANTNYIFSAWIKGTAQVGMSVTNRWTGTMAGSEVNPTSGWVKYSLPFNSGSETTVIVVFRDEYQGTTKLSYIDDVEVIAETSGTIPVTGVSVNPTSAQLTTGGTQQLQEEVLPTDATNKNVTWSTSDASVATVSTSGLVTAVAPGTATITVTTVDGSKTASSSITVNSGNIAVTSVSLSPASATLTVGGTQQLQEEVLPANATNKNVTWSTSDASVATVSTSGLVTAVAPGNATITVTTVDGSKTAPSSITVTNGGGETNLLLNPGFESGPTGWGLGSVFSVSTVDKYSGDQSLLLTGTGSYTTTAQQITVTANTNYIFSAWIKGAAQVGMSVTNRWTGTIAASEVNPTSGWVKYSLPFNSGSETTVIVVFRDEYQGATKLSYIDDVSVVLAPKSYLKKAAINESITNKITMFPNPMDKDNLRLTISGLTEGYIDVMVVDIQGKAVYQNSLKVTGPSSDLQLDNLNQGLYFLRVVNNGQTLNEKLIVR